MTILRILVSSPYNFFLVVAIGVAVLLAVRESRARGMPARDWAVLLGVALASGLLGSKLVFLDFRPIAPGEKTIVGAILVGVIMVLAAARALRIGTWRALDALSVPTLAAMAIGRIGCFLAGCCAGTETALPWGVRYGTSDVHVHPVQLYEMAADFVLIGILRRRGSVRWDGARFLSASLGYAAIRIGTETVRAGREHFFGLTAVQWSLLALATVLGVITLSRSPGVHGVPAVRSLQPLTARGSTLAALGVATALALISIGTGEWLVPLERLVVLTIASSLMFTALATMMPGWAPRTLSLLLAPQAGAFLMMQEPADAGPRRELIIGASTRSGTFDQIVGRNYGTDCDGGQTSWPTVARREQHVIDGELGLRQRLQSGNHVTVGARWIGGSDRLQSLDSGMVDVAPAPRLGISGLGGSVELERPATFMRFSLAGGGLVRDGERTHTPTGAFNLRAGTDRRFFFEMNLADRRYFSSLGEFSYAGLGYSGGEGRPRMMLGIGEGGIGEIVVPIRRFEIDFGFRGVTGRSGGGTSGDLWTLGVRQAITLRR